MFRLRLTVSFLKRKTEIKIFFKIFLSSLSSCRNKRVIFVLFISLIKKEVPINVKLALKLFQGHLLLSIL
jgi:hypothetical protein